MLMGGPVLALAVSSARYYQADCTYVSVGGWGLLGRLRLPAVRRPEVKSPSVLATAADRAACVKVVSTAAGDDDDDPACLACGELLVREEEPAGGLPAPLSPEDDARLAVVGTRGIAEAAAAPPPPPLPPRLLPGRPKLLPALGS